MLPNISNLNFRAGQDAANLATVALGKNGEVVFSNALGSTHVIADVVGYYDSTHGDLFRPFAPFRILDSRGPNGGWNGPLASGSSRNLEIAGVGGVPADTTAVVGNTTVTDPDRDGFVKVYPTGGAEPDISTINFVAGQTVANLTITRTGTNGSVAFSNSLGSAHVVYDLVGYFAAG